MTLIIDTPTKTIQKHIEIIISVDNKVLTQSTLKQSA